MGWSAPSSSGVTLASSLCKSELLSHFRMGFFCLSLPTLLYESCHRMSISGPWVKTPLVASEPQIDWKFSLRRSAYLHLDFQGRSWNLPLKIWEGSALTETIDGLFDISLWIGVSLDRSSTCVRYESFIVLILIYHCFMVAVTVASCLWVFIRMAKWAISEFKAFSESWPVNTGQQKSSTRPEAAPTRWMSSHYACSKPRGLLAGYRNSRNWATNSFWSLLWLRLWGLEFLVFGTGSY